MPALQVKRLNIFTGNSNKKLVQDISFDIYAGQTLALMGASGSGKSLTAMAIMESLAYGLYSTAEQLHFKSTKPALIMQNPADCFDPLLRIEQTFLESIAHYPKQNDTYTHMSDYEYMLNIFEEVGFENARCIAKCYPFELSGGMLHKVMIAIAIAQVQKGAASCIIADEPVAGLDSMSKLMLLTLLKSLQNKYGFALLYIDHDVSAAKFMAHKLAIMCAGKIVEYGPLENLLKNPQHQYTKELVNTFQPPNFNTTAKEIIRQECILSCKGLKKSYAQSKKQNNLVLNNIDLELWRGENLGIVGHNGAGKSTLVRALLALEKPDDGIINIMGKAHHTKERHWRKHIQAVFQHARLAINPRMQAYDIITEPLLAHGHKDKKLQSDLVAELLDMVQLPQSYARAYPRQMSGGQLQRLCIARALALKPDILLLDEPISDLDCVVAENILLMLEDLQKRTNVTLLYISHDLRSVLRLCQRILVLNNGQIVDNFMTYEFNNPKRHNAFANLRKCLFNIQKTSLQCV